MNDDLAYTVTFEFQERGIRVNGHWFPILKMEWVEGKTLERYIETHLDNRAELMALKNRFESMCMELDYAGIAHGDLQHGNIMVLPDGQLRLVDYDGMFVPSMKGLRSNELGHRNYQHPKRSATNFDSKLDCFASWVIYVSLAAIAESPDLYGSLAAGNDCLLFRRKDFEDVWNSEVFQRLETMRSNELRQLSNSLKWLVSANADSRLPLKAAAPPCTPPGNVIKVRSSKGTADDCDASIAREPSSTSASIDCANWWLDYRDDSGTLVFSGLIEPELTTPAPRNVIKGDKHAIYPGELTVLGFFAALLLIGIGLLAHLIYLPSAAALMLFVAMIIYLSVWRNLRYRRLVRNGIPVPGKIIEKKIEDYVAEDNTIKYSYHLRYQYPVKNPSGTKVIHASSVDCNRAFYNRFSIGDTVTVLYNEDYPNDSILYRLSIYHAS